MGRTAASSWLFRGVLAALTLLAVAPFWRTHLLPMQDYPHFLLFARALHDLGDPASPFSGTYTTGFALAPTLLPLRLTELAGRFASLELGGKLLWSAYAVGLPAASLYLLHVLGRDRWAVLLVFPLVFSYWVTGGFFCFATAAPLQVLGLALAARWLERRSWRRAAALASIGCALFLWHAIAWAQLVACVGGLWLLLRTGGLRARLHALLPLVPSLGLWAGWVASTVAGRPPAARPVAWPPFLDNASHFFDFIGPLLPGATGGVLLLGLLVAAGALINAPRGPGGGEPRDCPFRVRNPFAWLSILAALGYLLLPATAYGVEGIGNRQPWLAALLLVFGASVPARGVPRALFLGTVGLAGAALLLALGDRFAAFDRESAGASRLLDRLSARDTLLAPIGPGGTAAFPDKPLVAVELYASVRQGGLPNTSFAGYDINVIRYAGGKNPMPGLGPGWADSPALKRFDYVLLRAPVNALVARGTLQAVGQDAGWFLYGVCGSRVRPTCGT